MNQIFDIKRLMNYARLKYSLNRKMMLLSIGGTFAVLFVIGFFIGANINPSVAEPFMSFHTVSFVLMLFVGCLVAAGRAFQDMNSSEKAMNILMIPASTFEKWLTTFIFSSIGWMILTFVGYSLFAIINNGIWAGIFGLNFNAFNPLDIFFIDEAPAIVGRLIVYSYFALHATFFLGASAFKKYPVAKTALSVFIVNQGFSILAMITILITYGSVFEFSQTMEAIGMRLENIHLEWEDVKHYTIIPEIVLFYLIPIVLYITSFFKLKEREV